MCVELIMAAIKTRHWQVFFIVIYIIFSIIWESISFILIRGRDDDAGEDDAGDDRMSIFFRLIAGLFFACFTCTIALIVYVTSSASNGLGIGAYLKCSPVGRAIRSVIF
jgi:hypothetical protein